MKTNLDSIFKIDQSLETDGVWYVVTDETKFLLRRWSNTNPKIKAALAKHYKPHASQIQAGSLDSKREQLILTTLFVEVCLIDWKGVVIDGVETPFSKEAAIKFFMALPELANVLRTYAEDHKNYLVELGNS